MREDQAGNIRLASALVAFHRVWGNHTAENLSKTMLDLLDRAHSTSKASFKIFLFYPLLTHIIIYFQTGHITLDNIGTNDKIMEELQKHLSLREISFNARQRRIMCFPHIINIVVQHVIAKLSHTAAPEDEDDTYEEEGMTQSDDQSRPTTRSAAYARDPIARCRKIVVAIRSSGQRREKFENWIKTGEQVLLFYFNNINIA
jgi:hypothetical protein